MRSEQPECRSAAESPNPTSSSTSCVAGTRGPFWSIRPARILLLAVCGTQAIATLIAVYGLFMAPLGWKWAAFVWAYALVWALLSDRVKLLAYRILDPVKARQDPPESGAFGPGSNSSTVQ